MAIGESGVLSISGWSQDLTTDVVIALTVVDETDHLEWTRMIYRRASSYDESLLVKIPISSISHRFVVTAKVLRRIADDDRETLDVERYKLTSESSCEAITIGSTNSLPSLSPGRHTCIST